MKVQTIYLNQWLDYLRDTRKDGFVTIKRLMEMDIFNYNTVFDRPNYTDEKEIIETLSNIINLRINFFAEIFKNVARADELRKEREIYRDLEELFNQLTSITSLVRLKLEESFPKSEGKK